MITRFINDYFIIVVFICIVLHAVIGIYLNKIYYRKENKNTPMAFIPLANIYLIGSLAIHNFVGWILVFMILLNISYPININNEIIIKRIIPNSLKEPINIIILGIIILLLLSLIFKRKINYQNNIIEDKFLTEAELLREPSNLKRQAKLSLKNNGLDNKESNVINNDTPKPFMHSGLDNINQTPTINMPQPRTNVNPQMPKPFSQPNLNNKNKFPNNNPFNRREL